MKRRMVALVAVLLAGGKTASAFACEPPPFTRVPGISYFVATTTMSGRTGNEVRAQVISRPTNPAAMPTGAAILVPWVYATDCKPIPWDAARDGGPWSPPQAAAFYTGWLRPRNKWVSGLPTVDIHVPARHPEWHGEGGTRLRFPTVSTPPLTPQEFFGLYPFLPTNAEFLERQPAALRRLEAWVSGHQEVATREPARWAIDVLRGRFAGTAHSEFVRLLGAPATPRMLFCAHGSVGLLGPGTENYFAVAVIEIDSPESVTGATVSDFVLSDTAGAQTPFTRVVSVEEFTREPDQKASLFAHYLNPGGRVWQGALPGGVNRLRVRVALQRDPFSSPRTRCRVVVGPYAVEGPVDGAWPT